MKLKIIDTRTIPGSRISNLPGFSRKIAILIGNFKSPRVNFSYVSEGVASAHNMSYLIDGRFIAAYKTGVEFGGFEYDVPLRIHQVIRSASTQVNSRKDAIFFELGTGKGFVMACVLQYMHNLNFSYRQVFLFDSCLPNLISKNSIQEDSSKNIYYAHSFSQVKPNFSRFNNVNLIRGVLPESLLNCDIEYIDFLHVDLNNPNVENQCLNLLWGKLRLGGYVFLDDYAYSSYRETYEMINSFFDSFAPVLTFASGQGLVQKPYKSEGSSE